ncbi:hypothetical protein Hanom_Chr09g00831821 [Helianthus anomalus]
MVPVLVPLCFYFIFFIFEHSYGYQIGKIVTSNNTNGYQINKIGTSTNMIWVPNR